MIINTDTHKNPYPYIMDRQENFDTETPCIALIISDQNNIALENTLCQSDMIRNIMQSQCLNNLVPLLEEHGLYNEAALMLTPLVIFIDMQDELASGIEAVQTIRSDEVLKNTPIVVLSNQEDFVLNAFQNGASGYLKTPVSLHDIDTFLPIARQWPPQHRK